MKLCETPDCGRKHYAKGMCRNCYHRNLLGNQSESLQSAQPSEGRGTQQKELARPQKKIKARRQPPENKWPAWFAVLVTVLCVWFIAGLAAVLCVWFIAGLAGLLGWQDCF